MLVVLSVFVRALTSLVLEQDFFGQLRSKSEHGSLEYVNCALEGLSSGLQGSEPELQVLTIYAVRW